MLLPLPLMLPPPLPWPPLPSPQEGPYSLSDPTTLCAITEARARGEEGSSRIALPAPDPDASHHHQASSVFESKMHRMHGGRRGSPCCGRRRASPPRHRGHRGGGRCCCRLLSLGRCFCCQPLPHLRPSQNPSHSRCNSLPLPLHPAPPRPTAAGTVHSNGFGHLMRLNGREGGSKHATGRQLMQVCGQAAGGEAAGEEAQPAGCHVLCCCSCRCRHVMCHRGPLGHRQSSPQPVCWPLAGSPRSGRRAACLAPARSPSATLPAPCPCPLSAAMGRRLRGAARAGGQH